MRFSSNFLATPMFEPKSGNYMAYNHGNSIVILETQNWTVKKMLTDDEVIFRATSIHSLKYEIKIIYSNIWVHPE